MAHATKGKLEPNSPIHRQFGRIKKIFLAYAHNPDPYEQYIPPYSQQQLIADPALFQLVLQEKAEHLSRQQAKIKGHVDTVKRFADCLQSNGVPVAYDRYWEGQQIPNLLQHYEQQINDSDVVLLIISPSLKFYMENDVPDSEAEILLTKDFLYNLINVKKPEGTNFIPVFLNRTLDRSLIPTTLSSASTYIIKEPFDCTVGDMYDLYAYLTNQKSIEMAQPTSVIALPRRSSPFNFTPSRKPPMQPEQKDHYQRLCNQHAPLSRDTVSRLPTELAPYWQKVAGKLGFTQRDIQDCIDESGIGNNREASYQMIIYWQAKRQHLATVAEFAKALYSAECSHLLNLLEC